MTITVVAPNVGGTGLTGTPSNGQIPIGNGSGFTAATLTAGSGISITNGAGSITIAASTSGISAQYFVVGGGGGGGGFAPGVNWGAGGQGGYVSTGSLTLTQGTVYTVTVGAGGAAVGNNTTGGTGGQSVFGSITANGGAGGAGGGAGGGSGAGNVYASPGNSLGGPGVYYFSGTFAGGGSGGNPALTSGQTVDDGTWYGGGACATAGGGPITNFTRFNSGGGGCGSFSNGGSSQAGASGVVIISIPVASYSGTTTGSPRVSYASGFVFLTYKSSGSYTA